MKGAARLVHRRDCLCAPASVPRVHRTSSVDRPSTEPESCSAMPYGCPSSSSACPVRQSRCHHAAPSSASTCPHQLPLPGLLGPGLGSAAWSRSRLGSRAFRLVVDRPAPLAAQKVLVPSPAAYSARSRLSPKRLLEVQNYETSSSSSDSHSLPSCRRSAHLRWSSYPYRRTFSAKDFAPHKKSHKSSHPPLDLETVRIAVGGRIRLDHLQKCERRVREACLPSMHQTQLALHLQLRHLHLNQYSAL